MQLKAINTLLNTAPPPETDTVLTHVLIAHGATAWN